MKVLAAAAPLPQRSFFTHRIVDLIPAPIRQTESKMLGILRQKVGVGSSSVMILGQKILPAMSAMRGFASSAKELLFIVRLKFKLIDFFWLVRIGRFRRPCHRGT
ncbi:uncharacterized protein [Malus domestica]|uniref:uncharacterized protein isoform X2 n=1 Tax=Malus domestica TaxID=3750 RepID=UPI003974BDC7